VIVIGFVFYIGLKCMVKGNLNVDVCFGLYLGVFVCVMVIGVVCLNVVK